ncbi:hypothetical protein swp_1482 [Shewanella piezotolerans WP3]|uniref:Uncharacterized protein n=1 Tax=Shewanella piezotolerans (strain WP3 / JCM 13877) TaxID=225849 RepID=B8CKU2_SHEPW|nr:hypothetical protein swp_1482 [Shewanella piezotolerans WP3]
MAIISVIKTISCDIIAMAAFSLLKIYDILIEKRELVAEGVGLICLNDFHYRA